MNIGSLDEILLKRNPVMGGAGNRNETRKDGKPLRGFE